jgi:inositol hexakisphosphate/diphosphoinositol-pentakisphosphate kinase
MCSMDHSSSDENSDTFQEEELRCVLAVIRHGDRTPKQKMKMLVTSPRFLGFYENRVGKGNKKDLKIKTIKDLKELLAVSCEMISLYEAQRQKGKQEEKPNKSSDAESDGCEKKMSEQHLDKEEMFEKDQMKGVYTLRDVLQRWQLCGINRKVQMKPREWSDGTLATIYTSRINVVLTRKVRK